MYKQIDGVAVDSSLGPVLANINAGYYEKELLGQTRKPVVYFHYIDNTFANLNEESYCDTFLTALKSLHFFTTFASKK